MAPEAELSTATTARAESTPLLHPAIVPSFVANNSLLGPAFAPDAMTKPPVPLVATPVGGETPLPSGEGMVTGCGDPAGIGFPAPSKASALPASASETQSPPFNPTAIPHGLTRFGSVSRARPGMSETRLVWVNVTDSRRRSSRFSTQECRQTVDAECAGRRAP
jgi:hypothetical protein